MRGGCVATYQLSVFSALHNATYTLVLTARFVVFVCSHAITRLPLVGVFEIWHLGIFIKFQFDQNVTSPAGTLHEHQRTFVITSLSTLFSRMRNVSDRSCTVVQLYRKWKHSFFFYKTFSEFLSIFAVPLQQWLCERSRLVPYSTLPSCYERSRLVPYSTLPSCYERSRLVPYSTLPSCYEAGNIAYWTAPLNWNVTLYITAVSRVCGQVIVRMWSGSPSINCKISSRIVFVWRCGCHVILVNRFLREH